MDKKSLQVKVFLNLFGTYKDVRQIITKVRRGGRVYVYPHSLFINDHPPSPQSILNPKFLYPFQLLRPLQTMNLKPTVYPPN